MRRTGAIFAVIALTLAMLGAAQGAELRRVAADASSLFHAAERGNPVAQTRVGFMYETGRGLPQDYLLATYWYRRAAEQGYPPGQQRLGLMYDKGQGVGENYIVAHKWLNLAASASGRATREYYLRLRDAIAGKMTFAQITEAQRLAREWYPQREH